MAKTISRFKVEEDDDCLQSTFAGEEYIKNRVLWFVSFFTYRGWMLDSDVRSVRDNFISSVVDPFDEQ